MKIGGWQDCTQGLCLWTFSLIKYSVYWLRRVLTQGLSVISTFNWPQYSLFPVILHHATSLCHQLGFISFTLTSFWYHLAEFVCACVCLPFPGYSSERSLSFVFASVSAEHTPNVCEFKRWHWLHALQQSHLGLVEYLHTPLQTVDRTSTLLTFIISAGRWGQQGLCCCSHLIGYSVSWPSLTPRHLLPYLSLLYINLAFVIKWLEEREKKIHTVGLGPGL